jgi:hypothetical protein
MSEFEMRRSAASRDPRSREEEVDADTVGSDPFAAKYESHVQGTRFRSASAARRDEHARSLGPAVS